jgi:pimeloyl-ACP methyl ester carboxylesterase
MSPENRTLRLPDGRQMGYAVYGVPGGLPLLVCHGSPGSRLMLRMAHEAAADRGLHLIAPDRPGYGLSSARRRWRILDWADDVDALAERLGLERFAVVGISGGCPYALALACRMPTRVRLVAVISGLAPLDQEAVLQSLDRRQQRIFRAARDGSLVLRAVIMLGGRAWRHMPVAVLKRLMRLAPSAEWSTLANPGTQQAMLASFREAFSHGSRGVSDDLRNFSHPWGFVVSRVAVPALLWHGEADAIVPVGMGRYLARELRDCSATFVPGAGHYWAVDNIESVLDGICRRLASETISARSPRASRSA